MNSKKSLQWNCLSGRTFKNFKVPKTYSKAQNRLLTKVQNKRARTLNYIKVYCFEWWGDDVQR